MSNFSDRIELLSSNVFGSKNVANSLRKAPIEINRDVGPLSTLEGDPFAFSSISYPRDVTMDMANGHYMLFYINVQNKTKYIYQPADPDAVIGEIVHYPGNTRMDREYGGQPTKLATSEFVSYGDTDASYRAGLIGKGGTGNILKSDGVDLRKGRKAMTGFSSVLPTTTRITDSVAIYLPPNVSDSTTATYNNAEMGIIGAAAASGGDFITKFGEKDFAGAVKGLGADVMSLMDEALLKVGSTIASGLTGGGVSGDDIKGFANKAFGRATNPYMEVIFQAVPLRTFSYNFTFSPRNEDETNDVKKIIKIFRFHMLPELKGSNSRYMTLPSTFDIHYMYQMDTDNARENPFYSKIATCVLTSCAVDYTPGAVKSFESGAPTQITMNLSFQETEMLTKQHIEKGY